MKSVRRTDNDFPKIPKCIPANLEAILPVQADKGTHSELETKQTHCIDLPATSSPQSILEAAVPDKNCQSCAKHALTEHGRAQPWLC